MNNFFILVLPFTLSATIELAIPHASKSPQWPKKRINRMRNIEFGQTEIQMGVRRLKIFHKERTVIDSFRCLSQ